MNELIISLDAGRLARSSGARTRSSSDDTVSLNDDQAVVGTG